MIKPIVILAALTFLSSCNTSATAVPTTDSIESPTPRPTETQTPSIPNGNILFSGYEWEVRDSGLSGPGPNRWDRNNVWLDENGDLHLKITHTANGWHCAEVMMTERLGFGTYQFEIIGPIDRLDPNIVLGLFNYPTADVGPDATNEIDIEFAKWGDPEAPIGNFTVWPVLPGLTQVSESFPVQLNGTYTTHRFTWQSTQIHFESLHGHRADSNNLIAEWLYQPQNASNSISQQPMPVHINLWLFQGQPPTAGKEVEIMIRSFTFTPLE